MRAKLIVLGVAAAALLVAGIALWRMARAEKSDPAAATATAPSEPPSRSSPGREPPPRPPADVPDAAVAAAPADAPALRDRTAGRPRAIIVLGRLREALRRTDEAVRACITGKPSGRALLQFTAVPVDGRVSIEHAEVLPNVGKERTSIEDRTLLDCLAKAHAGTPLSDVGDMPVIIRTRVVIEDGVMSENWIVSATPQARDD